MPPPVSVGELEYFALRLPDYQEGGGLSMVFGEPRSTTRADFKDLSRLPSARLQAGAYEGRTNFGPDVRDQCPLAWKLGQEQGMGQPIYQDVAYLIGEGGKTPLKVLAYLGCPVQIGRIEPQRALSLRKRHVLRVTSAKGNVLYLDEHSALPFVAAGNQLLYACWNALNVELVFSSAGTVFDTEDARYLVTEAAIEFTDQGVTMTGIRKTPRK